ncbi:MAG: GspE/PulE family protein [Hyphomicrobiaceae bacterium]|nr:GspE/PulE family protein [Hyphomicrobiaceae bacterium]
MSLAPLVNDVQRDLPAGPAPGATSANRLALRAAALRLPYADVSDMKPDAAALAKLPAADAARLGVLPLSFASGILTVATGEPDNFELEQRLGVLTRCEVALIVSAPEAIAAALKRCDGAGKVMEDVGQEFRIALVRETDTGKAETVDLETADQAAAPIVRLVNSTISAALEKRASDIHIHARADGVVIDFRIDGVLNHALGPFDPGYHAPLISRIKIMAELDIAEHRVPQDGRFKLRLRHADVDFRVSVLPGVFGEDVVIRILDKSHLAEQHKALTLEALGFEAAPRAVLTRATRTTAGMLLVTGPTGSGKTTTLYACLTEMNDGEGKIITIEDPVEYELPSILQIPVNEKKNLTFARGLRAILRHDPDKVMVGEIRDKETASIAVQAALTGHLVVTTLHANNAFDVISRFTHMGLDLHELVAALNCVVAQRLVRRLCASCSIETRHSAEEINALLYDETLARSLCESTWRAPRGCEACSNTGYRGRLVAAEVLEVDNGLRELILERRPAAALRDYARRSGMATLRDAAIAKAQAGVTSLAEVARVT